MQQSLPLRTEKATRLGGFLRDWAGHGRAYSLKSRRRATVRRTGMRFVKGLFRKRTR